MKRINLVVTLRPNANSKTVKDVVKLLNRLTEVQQIEVQVSKILSQPKTIESTFTSEQKLLA